MRRSRAGSVSVVLAVAALVLWLLSYSWLLGFLLPPEAQPTFEVSPWLLAELAAIPLGASAVILAVLAIRAAKDGRRRVRVWAWVGGAAAALSLLSVTG
ncbi:hypothetical protein [Naasia sp. SYSU D00057]|uniref:hypothetical protein n=1 Tax=Naasia sp. SYSU D00057 TaxID=2817380 RepID=UPI001B315578|nr:hypothetical protein [Naasia sp. SYSU D00057]